MGIRSTLDVCINPLDDESHPDGTLMNIVTGELAHPDVNVDDAVNIGLQVLSEYKKCWPESFYDPLGKMVISLDVKKKHILVGQKRLYDQELIYARVIGLLASTRDIDFDNV